MTSQYTSTCVRTASILGSNSASQQGGFRASSPPQTPQNRQTRRMRSQTGPRVPAHPKRETFLDDITPVDGVRDEEGGDEKDPHDLAFSPKLMTRASLVDNMLMALDQFSNSAPNTFVSREPNATLRYNRQRGNTFSSNASSDYDFRTDENLPPHSFHRGRGSNSNSNALYPRSLETVHSVYEEDEPSSRSRVLESQTAYASLDPRWSGHSKSGRKSGKSSGSSSVDLGQALSGYKLGAAGNRRSQSFDFGSDRRRLPIFQSETNVTGNSYDLSAEMEAAPTPIIHAGPSRGHSPTRHNTTAPLAPVYDPVSAGGRNSTKASKNQPARKGRAGTVGTVVTKNGDDLRNNLENLPPMPSYFPPPPQSPALPSRKLSQVAPADLAQSSKDRPGFFRRVFGSKSTNVINLQASDSENSIARAASTTSLDDETFRAMAAPAKLQKPSSKDANPTTSAAGKEQTISKKSSAFFRRRKKSVTQQMPPPPPLSLHPVRTEAAEQSPVSSLRQVMDAYLVSTSLKSPNWDSREDSIQGFNTAYASSTQRNDGLPANIEKTQDSPHEPEQTISKPLTPASRANLNLKIPQRDNQDSTFLADSSGTEEINSRSRENTPSRWSDGKARSSPSITSHDPFSEGSLPIRFPPTSAGNSVSSETKTPHSSPSPSVPHSGILAKSPRPSQLKLQRGASDNSSPRSLSNEPGVRNSPLPLASDSSLYKSAPSTPVLGSNENDGRSPTINITESPRTFRAQPSSEDDREQALKIFENRDENLDPSEASAWLGDSGDARERVRMAYMSLFDWKDVDILSSLRGLCARIALKGESQQVDRMLDAFSKRWCECNANHGFKSTGKFRSCPGTLIADSTRCGPHHLLFNPTSQQRLASCGY